MLFKFFMIIFLIGFTLVSLLGFSVLRSFRDFFFGSPKSKQRPTSQSRQSSQAKSSTNRQKQSREKIITADEGEYVDYEEVKE
jgi:predicted lipid-binding transport protein (Tim44 family)